MPDRNKKFHEFALKSILFKGRSDWYFGYLKTERIAHALIIIAQRSGKEQALNDLVREAALLPQTLTRFAAGEADLSLVLADIFSLLSLVRLAHSKGDISKENAAILGQEYEFVAEKLAGNNRISPFVTAEDLSVQALPEEPTPLFEARSPLQVKDNNKGLLETSKGQSIAEGKRTALILSLVRKHPNISIKGISAVITDCSEKTIQRDLHSLIEQGLVRKEGERRWSVYVPT